MKFPVIAVLAVFLFVAPVFGQKIYIDYDHDYDLTSIKTYSWKTTEATSMADTDPLLHNRIRDLIQTRLDQSALTDSSGDPDVYITYHCEERDEMRLDTTDYGYGYPSYWDYGYGGGYGGYYGDYYGGSWGGGISTTTISTYRIGTLVVDIVDAKTDELVWRGTAANVILVDNPHKMTKKLDKAISKMASQWKKTRKKSKG